MNGICEMIIILFICHTNLNENIRMLVGKLDGGIFFLHHKFQPILERE